MFKANDQVRIKGSSYLYTVLESYGDMLLVQPDDARAAKAIKLFTRDVELVRRPFVPSTSAHQVMHGKFQLDVKE